MTGQQGQAVSVDMLVSLIGEQAVEIRVLRGQLAQANAVLEEMKKIPAGRPLTKGDEEGGMGDVGLETRDGGMGDVGLETREGGMGDVGLETRPTDGVGNNV